MVSLLVAADEQNVIGANNTLPWHLPNDLKYFKNLTWGMPIVMGRKTFESIGKPLPGRKNIVITRNRDWKAEGAVAVNSIEEAMDRTMQDDVKEIFVIGDAEIFKTVFPKATGIYLTRIPHWFQGDVYFPPIDAEEWALVKEHHHSKDEKNNYLHTFQIWERK